MVDTNKGDSNNPKYRSRLVVQETKGATDGTGLEPDSVFSPTPPLEGLKLLMSEVMTRRPGERTGGEHVPWLLRRVSLASLFGGSALPGSETASGGPQLPAWQVLAPSVGHVWVPRRWKLL